MSLLNYYDDSPIWVSADDCAHEITQLKAQLIQCRKELNWALEDAKAAAYARDVHCKAAKTAEAAVDKLLEATGGVTPEYQRQDAFTICVLVDPVSERVFTGAACCGPQDTFNLEIGKAISLGRAMNQRAEYFASAAYAK